MVAMKNKEGGLFVRDAPEIFIGDTICCLGFALKYFRDEVEGVLYKKDWENDDIC